MSHSQLPNDSWHNSSDPLFAGLDLLLQLKPLFIPLYTMLVAVACTGNLSLILLIALTKKLHCTTNFLIGNLAAADFIMCLACVPLTVSYAFEVRGWLFGTFLCHFVTLLQAATVFVSVLSLTAIAIDRYVVVAYPLRRRASCSSCLCLVACIWLLSLLASLPSWLHTHYLDLNAIGHDVIICEEFWPRAARARLLYSCLLLLLSYLLPLLAVSISFCAISYRLRRRSVPGAACPCQDKWTKTKQKTFRVLAVSVLSFAVCWLPLQVVNFLRDLDEDFAVLDKRYISVVQVSCHLLAMSSACYNPFIYAALHDKLLPHLRSCFCCRRKGSSTRSCKASRFNTCSALADAPTGLSEKDTHIIVEYGAPAPHLDSQLARAVSSLCVGHRDSSPLPPEEGAQLLNRTNMRWVRRGPSLDSAGLQAVGWRWFLSNHQDQQQLSQEQTPSAGPTRRHLAPNTYLLESLRF